MCVGGGGGEGGGRAMLRRRMCPEIATEGRLVFSWRAKSDQEYIPV